MCDRAKYLIMTIDEKIKNKEVLSYVLTSELAEYVNLHYEKLLEWIKEISHTNTCALNCLGYMYEHGLGMTKNLARAYEIYTISAAQDNPTAQYNLGCMYMNGVAVDQDYKKAYDLYIYI